MRGIPVVLINTRPDIDSLLVLRRLEAALALIETYQPWRFRHLRRDVARILVERYACRGAFIPEFRTCVTELTFLANPAFSEAQLAASILHEGMHARVYAMLGANTTTDRAREERLCRRAELEFGLVVPGGGPVVERALQTLALADDDVAPAIDRAEAARRVTEVDRAARTSR